MERGHRGRRPRGSHCRCITLSPSCIDVSIHTDRTSSYVITVLSSGSCTPGGTHPSIHSEIPFLCSFKISTAYRHDHTTASSDLIAYWPLRDGPRTIFGNYATQGTAAPLTRLAHAVDMGSLRVEATTLAPPHSLAPHVSLVPTSGSQPSCWLAGDLTVDDKEALLFGSSYGGYGAFHTAQKVFWRWFYSAVLFGVMFCCC